MQCLFQEQSAAGDAVNVPVWACVVNAGGSKVACSSWTSFTSLSEFEIFLPETHATDILLNSHRRFIAVHKKRIVTDVMFLLWGVAFAILMDLWTLLVILWKE